MPDEVLQNLELLVRVLEAICAAALVVGFVVATIYCLRRYFREGATTAVARYRQSLGRVVLIGLEILVATTIIKTITLDPTLESIGFLAIMVAIRTALGWTTVLELNGRWPWQRPKHEPVRSQTNDPQ
jgi:uncharacterized membrane protein